MRTIPQRQLRNEIGKVLREVEAGERLRITVDGRPVADLVPIERTPQAFVPYDEVVRLLERFPLDREFARDVEAAGGTTVDEL